MDQTFSCARVSVTLSYTNLPRLHVADASFRPEPQVSVAFLYKCSHAEIRQPIFHSIVAYRTVVEDVAKTVVQCNPHRAIVILEKGANKIVR